MFCSPPVSDDKNVLHDGNLDAPPYLRCPSGHLCRLQFRGCIFPPRVIPSSERQRKSKSRDELSRDTVGGSGLRFVVGRTKRRHWAANLSTTATRWRKRATQQHAATQDADERWRLHSTGEHRLRLFPLSSRLLHSSRHHARRARIPDRLQSADVREPRTNRAPATARLPTTQSLLYSRGPEVRPGNASWNWGTGCLLTQRYGSQTNDQRYLGWDICIASWVVVYGASTSALWRPLEVLHQSCRQRYATSNQRGTRKNTRGIRRRQRHPRNSERVSWSVTSPSCVIFFQF